MRYRWQKYILEWKDGDSIYLLNLLNKSIVRVSPALVESRHRDRDIDVEEDDSELGDLVRTNFLIPADLNDRDLFHHWFDLFCRNNAVMEVVLLLTYDCNFACTYCYQEAKSRKRSRLPSRLAGIAKWLRSAIENRRPRLMRLTFFGGEPLLKAGSVTRLCRYVRKIGEGTGTECRFDVVTNGYLLDSECLRQMEESGVEHFQITLDGPREVHNARRFLRNGEGTFNTVLRNVMRAVLDTDIHVKLRTNIDKHNVHAYERLLHQLRNAELQRKIELSIVPTKRTLPCLPHCAEYCFREDEAVSLYKQCLEMATTLGFLVSSGIEIGPCMAISKGSIAILPNGAAYKCTNLIGHEGHEIGNVLADATGELLDCYMRSPWEQCVSCTYVPVCAGGCRFQALSIRGDIEAKLCRKSLFENTLNDIYAARTRWRHAYELQH